MRVLTFSVGNTFLAVGLWTDGRLAARWRVPAREAAGAAGFARRVAPRIRGTFDRAAFCSVVPALAEAIRGRMDRASGVAAAELDARSPHGLEIGYRRPGLMGADRIAAALGARVRLPGRDVIIVDCGTATTVTALGRDGRVRGGAILPGLALWPAMLAARTAQLPAVALRAPRSAVGRSPREGIASGIFHGHAGAVRELVARIAREAFGRRRPAVVGTGGAAESLAGAGILTAADPDMVLRGLWSFAESGVDCAR
jgi:type III pantothenate kinase